MKDLNCMTTFVYETDEIRSPFTLKNRIGRLIWWAVQALLFRTTPRPMVAWRRFLLRCFGAKLGRTVKVYSRALIWAPWNLEMNDHSCMDDDVDCYNAAPVRIGRGAVVSRGAVLCTATHDHSDKLFPVITRPIVIEESAWVAARAFVSPGVTIGKSAVIGACSVVTRDVAQNAIVAGNPAKVIRCRTQLGG
jgi:putative colanic acid biosynthesis acetyltransferase WcaF